MTIERKRSIFRSKLLVGVLGIMLLTPSLSLGWGAGGHMMVASIALKRLNPRAKAKATELLAIKIDPAEVTAKSTNFVNAAHWADDLRPFARFDHFKALHFIDQPFSIDSTPLPSGVPEPDNIVKALEDNVNILKTSTDKNAQAQALRFVIHFVGDIHQPLHCATRVSNVNPDGDRGGNSVSIKIRGANGQLKTTNLHSYWDSGIGTFPKTGPNFAPPPLKEIGPATLIATKLNPATAAAVKLNQPFNYTGWAGESFKLGQTVAYKGMKNGVQPTALYNKNATKVVRQRVSWGGYRLAALLNSIWP